MSKSLKELEKELKKLNSKPVKTPDKKKCEDEQEKLQQKITTLSVQIAKKRWELDRKIEEAEAVRNKQHAAKSELESASSQLKEHITSQKQHRSVLQKEFQGKPIKNPEEEKKRLNNAITEISARMAVDGGLSNSDEKKFIRDLKRYKQELELVQDYIDKGMHQKNQSLEEKKTTVRNSSETHKSKFKIFTECREDTDKAYGKVSEVREERNKLQEELKAAKLAKTQLAKDFRKAEMDHKDFKQKIGRLQGLIRIKKREQEDANMGKEQQQPPTKGDGDGNKKKDKKDVAAKQREQKKMEEEKKEQEAAEKEKQSKADAIKLRREKAKAEYERLKKEYDSNVKTFEAGESKKNSNQTAEVLKEDPNESAKAMCRSLIDVCKDMLPKEIAQSSPNTGKKKKRNKKKRLRFTPYVFANFEKVGVTIPKNSTDIEKTISALEEKIQSYDETKT